MCLARSDKSRLYRERARRKKVDAHEINIIVMVIAIEEVKAVCMRIRVRIGE